MINYCLSRTELGLRAHTLSWVTLLCTGMAGLGRAYVPTAGGRREHRGVQVFIHECNAQALEPGWSCL